MTKNHEKLPCMRRVINVDSAKSEGRHNDLGHGACLDIGLKGLSKLMGSYWPRHDKTCLLGL